MNLGPTIGGSGKARSIRDRALGGMALDYGPVQLAVLSELDPSDLIITATAVGLLVYGLIIYVNPAVKAAFEMARQGRSPQQILAAFNPYQPTFYPPAGASPTGGESAAGDQPFGQGS